ncbi:MAG: glycoside hydrolase family 2 TIM barrel-domain containing protein, partial [Acidobacteriota bacterium]
MTSLPAAWSQAQPEARSQAQPEALAEVHDARRVLSDGWAIRSSAEVEADGAELSRPGFDVAGWHAASVPSTVVAALVADGTLPDPNFGMNLREMPGADYPLGRIFSKLPMPEGSPFRSSWWFRTEFAAPLVPGVAPVLNFDGINYRANVWLNGELLADRDEVAGAYRTYAFDVADRLREGTNALAVEVFPPGVDDLAITWVDWNPMLPDKAMGIWRDVYLTSSGPVSLQHPHVTSDVELPSDAAMSGGKTGIARLTVSVDLRNTTDQPQHGRLLVGFADRSLNEAVTLEPGEVRTVTLTPERHPELVVENPRLWWPIPMGEQNLYDLDLAFQVETGDSVARSDSTRVRFGIREITSELTDEGHRLFRVNGRPVLIRGAGWTPDFMLGFSPERMAAELAYVRDMGLNTVRLEGKMEPKAFFDLADELGILVMAGWCCCSHWERWAKWSEEDHRISQESLRSQIRRLRRHPSLLMWLNASDIPPPARVEKAYLEILDELRWPNPVVSSASAKPAEHSGPSGVKMNGPYEWIPPSYWLTDPGRFGGAWGFATEVGPGPVVPPADSVRAMLPESSWWPIDEQWLFHAGSGRFDNLDLFNEALSARYGAPTGLEDYTFKAQLLAYDGLRAMFEAYARNKYTARNRYTATGVIQWMLNDAWPSMIWHLYDYYLRPGGAYFGAKKALEPVHVQYSYDDHSVVVVNGTHRPLGPVTARAQVFDVEMELRFAQELKVEVAGDVAQRVFTVPEL